MGLCGYVTACSHSRACNHGEGANGYGSERSYLDASHGRGLAEKHVGSTASTSLGSLLLLTPQTRDACEKRTHCWPHFSVLPSANCAIACRHAFLSMDRLLAITLMRNVEGSGDARLLFSEILQHLTATCFLVCMLSRYIPA